MSCDWLALRLVELIISQNYRFIHGLETLAPAWGRGSVPWLAGLVSPPKYHTLGKVSFDT